MRRTAQILGHDDDAATYAALHDQIRAAFIARWVHADGTIGSGSQTSYVLALKFGLVPDELQSKAFERLTADVTGRGNHLSTGFLGTPFLLSVLQDGGRGDIAYELLTQDSYPSWGYMLGRYTAELGATVTITAGDAALSVHDPSATAPGHLINGEHVLPQALQARTASGFGPIAGASQPLTLTTWTAPVSNGPVTIGLKQPVAASDPLRTGGYAKTLTFTLSTTSP